MPVWRFLDYLTESRERPIIDWYGTLDPPAKASFDLLVIQLADTEDWEEVKPSRRKFLELGREHKGLTELKFEVWEDDFGKVKKKQFRALGILKKAERTFVFLNGCEKHGTMGTIPPNAFEKAMKLKAEFEAGKGNTDEHPF